MQGHLGCVVDFERKEKVTVELRVIPNGPETDASEGLEQEAHKLCFPY